MCLTDQIDYIGCLINYRIIELAPEPKGSGAGFLGVNAMFNNLRYVTKGVAATVPLGTQLLV